MPNFPSFSQMRDYGFHLRVPGATPPRAWINGNLDTLAMDAATITAHNSAIPAELTAYYEPEIIEIMTRPHKATEVFSEVQKGDWTTSHAKFMMSEYVGSSQPYTDYGDSRTADVNFNWLTRQQYLYQIVITYGDFEEALTSQARIQLVAQKQAAAAHILANDANTFYLYGIAGMDIYGLLNDPSLPAAVAPLVPTSGAVVWDDKNTKEIYDDVLYLFSILVEQSGENIDSTTPLILTVSGVTAVNLGKATEHHNVSVMDMLNKYFSSLKIVTIPELGDVTSGESIMLIAPSIQGKTTGNFAFSDKLRTGRVVPDLSSHKQKWTSSTYGCIIKYPFGIATMTGVK